MHFSFSDGREINAPDMCGYCNVNTGGEHELDCPFRKKIDSMQSSSKVRIFKILDDGTRIEL